MADNNRAAAIRAELIRREIARRQGGNATAVQEKGLLRKGYDLLNKPSEWLGAGLDKLASKVPAPEPQGKSGRLEKALGPLILGTTRPEGVPENPLAQPGVIQDVLEGTPRVAAETLAEAAPQFVDAPSILSAGAGVAMKPALKLAGMTGKFASQLGKLSGATPEALQAVAKEPGLLFAPGRKAAGKAVEAATNAAKGALRLDEIKEPKKLIQTAEALAKRGKLTPGEAVRARQEVDTLFDTRGITRQAQQRLRRLFDGIAKTDPAIAEADRGFVRGTMAERLRSVVPLTKTGEPRQLMTGAVLTSAAYNPTTLASLPLVSPLAQALLAAGGGTAVRAAEKVTPAAAVAAKNLYQALTNKEK